MTTVQDLIKLCDRQQLFDEFAKRFCEKPEDIKDDAAQRFYDFLDTLLAKTPVKTDDDIVICEPVYDSDCGLYYSSTVISAKDLKEDFRVLDFFEELNGIDADSISDETALALLEKQDELFEKGREFLSDKPSGSFPGHIESYAYEYEPWDKILGYIVPPHIIGSPMQYIFTASVLYEMTFFGYDEKELDKERKELEESIEEIEQFKSLPPEQQKEQLETIEDLEREFGFTDNRTDEEKEHDLFVMRKDGIKTSLEWYREMKRVYNDFTCDMKYFITERERDGTWYHEWAKGKHNGETFWNDDSTLLSVETMRDIGLYDFFYDVIPHYDAYEDAVVDKELWERIKERSKEYSTQIQECIAEAESWVQETFKEYDVFTIRGQ
ncbi:MAG: hypothetical protein IJM32_03260 [Ruminococcus sp.]|nr:hypothetical protein [Ruminococcus sp.]